MRIKRISLIEDIIYVMYCILTLGFVWVIRIIITKAIVVAFEQKEYIPENITLTDFEVPRK